MAKEVTPKPKKAKRKKLETVSVSSELRKVHSWFDGLVLSQARDAEGEKRAELCHGKTKLVDDKLTEVVHGFVRCAHAADAIGERMKKQGDELKAEWGRSGVTKFPKDNPLVLLGTSYSYGIDLEKLKKLVGFDVWAKIAVESINVDALLLLANDDERLRDHVKEATRVTQLTVKLSLVNETATPASPEE
jgi:hypothetical protein